jgi:hypothetical protein
LIEEEEEEEGAADEEDGREVAMTPSIGTAEARDGVRVNCDIPPRTMTGGVATGGVAAVAVLSPSK